MPSYLKDLEPILMLLLGWSLGLLSPQIAERIRRSYRQRDLVRAVLDELAGLQYTMAFVAYRIRSRNCEVSDEFIDKMLPIFKAYQGPDRKERTINALVEIRKVPEEQRAAEHQLSKKSNAGLALKQYALPLFVTQVSDLAICSIDFQRAVLHVRYHLDLFNQFVPYLQSFFDKTFTKLSAAFHKYTSVLAGLQNHPRVWHRTGQVPPYAQIESVCYQFVFCRESRTAAARSQIYVTVFSGAASQNDYVCRRRLEQRPDRSEIGCSP